MKTIEAEEQFNAWLLEMADAIKVFLALLPADLRVQLDGSPSSLDKLEAWLLLRYPSLDAAKSDKEAPIIGGAARYFGESLRTVTASHWAIELDDERFAFRGLPILRGGKLGPRGDCPQSMVTASIVRRTGQYMSSIMTQIAARSDPT